MNVRTIAISLLASLAMFAACQGADSAHHAHTTVFEDAAATPPLLAPRAIQPEEIRGAVRLLSSDAFEGRGVGSRGDEVTRAYIESEFERLSLKPMGQDGGFTQAVPMLGITTEVTQQLAAKGANGTKSFEAPTDYTAVAGSAAASAEWKDAEVVFCGYGIEAKEQQWDDWKGHDVRGKVLLVMNDDPSSDPALFAGKTRLYYGRWTYKFEEAARRGAIGHDSAWPRYATSQHSPTIRRSCARC